MRSVRSIHSLHLVGLGLALVGCGDPCLDDGAGRGRAICEANSSLAGTGSETDAEAEAEAEAEASEAEAEASEAEAEAEAEAEETAETVGEETVGEEMPAGASYCDDADGDGFGDPDACQTVPEGEPPPPGTVPEDMATDCDDQASDTFPGAAENDSPDACMQDADDDGFGDDAPANPNVEIGTDCDDSNSDTYPGAAELEGPQACMQDEDGDGYGEQLPPEGVDPGSDCNDGDDSIFMCVLWCADADDDGFGDSEECIGVPPGEDGPPGSVPNDLDCDDADGDKVICVDVSPSCADTPLGGGVQLDATVSGGDGNTSYAWDNAATLDDATIATPLATPTATTTYTVTVSDGLGNLASAQITVHITDAAWILGGPNSECTPVGFFQGNITPHSFSPDGTVTCTTENSDPTVFICPPVLANATISGTLLVEPPIEDDDFIGFVWGWQNPQEFYLLHWKRATQTLNSCESAAGITVKRIAKTLPGWSGNDFTCNVDTPNSTVLLTPADTTTQGWVHGVEYGVELAHASDQSQITITNLDTQELVAEFVVADSSYPSGQFGTYDFSQIRACSGPWTSSCL